MAVGYWWMASALFCFVVACLVVFAYPKGAGEAPLDFFEDESRERRSREADASEPDPALMRSAALPQLGAVRLRLGEIERQPHG